ncbi:hypothetical protein COCNU_scaffold004215G000020 [Cocos nucifera]|nr:hypothetical protein [Cocos nucifera]
MASNEQEDGDNGDWEFWSGPTGRLPTNELWRHHLNDQEGSNPSDWRTGISSDQDSPELELETNRMANV